MRFTIAASAFLLVLQAAGVRGQDAAPTATATGPAPAPSIERSSQPSPDGAVIWFDQPARSWNEALPVGNGRLGAMDFGDVQESNYVGTAIWTDYRKKHEDQFSIKSTIF